MNQESRPRPRIDWQRLVLAGVLATVAFMAAGYLLGLDPLGYGAVLAPGASDGVQDLVGLASNLLACLAYALVYALLFVQVRVWGRPLMALIYALVMTSLSIILMPGAPALDALGAFLRLLTLLASALVIVYVYRPAAPR